MRLQSASGVLQSASGVLVREHSLATLVVETLRASLSFQLVVLFSFSLHTE